MTEHAPATSSRRGLLMGLAAAAAVPAPTLAAVLAPATGADPIFAVIEAYERVVGQKSALYARSDEFEAALPEEQRTWSLHFGSKDRWPPQGCADAPEWIDVQLAIGQATERQCDLELALLTTAPTTVEGAIALLAHLGAAEFPEERGMDGAESLLTVAGLSYDKRIVDAADAFPAALAAALSRIVASRPSILARASAGAAAGTAMSVDPVFAVIFEHRTAQEQLHAACEATELDIKDDPCKQRAEARAFAVELPLLVTSPTTVAGVAALLEYVGSDAHEQWQGEEDRVATVLSYAHGWENSGGIVEAARTFPRRVGATLRSLIEKPGA